MKRVQRPLSLFTLPIRCETMCYGSELLPPSLLARCRQRATRALLFVGPLGTPLNTQEKAIGEELALEVRQACLTVRTGLLLYLGSGLSVGRHAELRSRPPDPVGRRFSALHSEGWPRQIIADALGISSTTALEMVRRWPRGTLAWQSNEYQTWRRSPPDVADPARNEVVAVWLSRYGEEVHPNYFENVARYCTRSGQAPEVVHERILWAARARARLRQLELEPPDIGRPLKRIRRLGTVSVRPGPMGPTEAGFAQASAYRQLRAIERAQARQAAALRRADRCEDP